MPMPASVDEYYASRYQEVIVASEEDCSYESIAEKVPTFPKGWLELSRLPSEIKLEFLYKYWTKTFPFHPRAYNAIGAFFSRVDDLGVYLVKDKEGSYFAEFVYSIKDGSSFYRGGIPADEDAIDLLNASFDSVLPKDYLSFFRIHDGFGKSSDTGILRMEQVIDHYQKIESETKEAWPSPIEPGSLIPFYECFGLHTYQCFFKNWHPMQSMGNIHYSSIDKTISRYDDPESTLAFETFSDWLAFYLEEIIA
jgi:hypothetical protein